MLPLLTRAKCARPALAVITKPQHGGLRGLGGAPALGCPRELRHLLGGVHVRVPIWLGAPRALPVPPRARALPGAVISRLPCFQVREIVSVFASGPPNRVYGTGLLF